MWFLLKCAFALVCFSYFTIRNDRKIAQTESLKEKWKTAREKRRAWKREHPWIKFDDPEYQKFWEIEIGAEDFYILSTKCNDYNINISWFRWRLERKEAEQKDDN